MATSSKTRVGEAGSALPDRDESLPNVPDNPARQAITLSAITLFMSWIELPAGVAGRNRYGQENIIVTFAELILARNVTDPGMSGFRTPFPNPSPDHGAGQLLLQRLLHPVYPCSLCGKPVLRHMFPCSRQAVRMGYLPLLNDPPRRWGQGVGPYRIGPCRTRAEGLFLHETGIEEAGSLR